MIDGNGFRLLLRVRIGRKLNTEQECLDVEFGNHQVTIRSEKNNQALNESTRLVLSARGFPTEDEAHDFGAKLRDAVSVGALCSRLGADPDTDLVVQLDSAVYFHFRTSVTGVTVLSDPAQFTGALTVLAAPLPMDKIRSSVRLLNLAMINADHIAQIILAVSAVESLVESLVVARCWGADKRKYLNELASRIENEFPGDSGFQRIANEIRNIKPLSVGSGIEQVLNDNALYKEWKSFYGRRSSLVHGNKPLDRQELGKLANDAIHLCTKIILITLKRKGASLPESAATRFGIL